MKKGMGNSSSYKQMQVLQKNVINDDINGNIDNNGQSNVNKKIKITTTKEEKIISTNSNNNINGQPLISNVVVNNRLNHSPKSSRPGSNGNLNKRPSQNSFNSKRNQSPLTANVNNNINQQMKSGNVVFNSKIKTDRAQYSTNSAGSMSGKDNILEGNIICSFLISIFGAGPSFNTIPLFPSKSNPPFSICKDCLNLLPLSVKLNAKFSTLNSIFSF